MLPFYIHYLCLPQGKIYTNVDFVIFGAFTLLAGFVCLRLPETLGKSMPETIADLDLQAQGHTQRSKVEVMDPEQNVSLSEDKLRLLQDEIEQNFG